MNILGISALYHDSAASLCCDGTIVAAASEERFTRKKADASLPVNAIAYCLSCIDGGKEAIDAVVYYDNPILTLDRWLTQCIWVSPQNEKVIEKTYKGMFSDKIWIHDRLEDIVGTLGKYGKLLVCEHHISHAASAFYPSPFEEAAIVTLDGVGEWATTTIGYGKKEEIKLLREIKFPNSLGLLYSAFTYFCGFKVNFGEYKLMGLAPYGEPVYYQCIIENLIDIKEDGSFLLNLDYFAYMTEQVMTGKTFENLFGMPRRIPEQRITKPYMDLAASIQKVIEEVVYKIVKYARELTGSEYLVMAGGIALNCVANGKIQRSGLFKDIWIQPAAGDAGCAIGSALYAEYSFYKGKRKIDSNDSQKGSYLGPYFSNGQIKAFLEEGNCIYHYYECSDLFPKIARWLAEDKVIGIFNGKMEFGPRALGGRSIIANPMASQMQAKLNLKIKYRESFRPFAPAVLEESASKYFDIITDSPYMLMVADVKEELRYEPDFNKKISSEEDIDMLQLINQKRSTIPAVTHVDYSARVQTVNASRNPYFYQIIKAFEEETGCGVIVNTSFNVRGEPIVCTPQDAYICFMHTDMDVLVLENFVLIKEEQPLLLEDSDWRDEYELD